MGTEAPQAEHRVADGGSSTPHAGHQSGTVYAAHRSLKALARDARRDNSAGRRFFIRLPLLSLPSEGVT